MDVVVWLRGLGLGRYEAAFRENEIDETVLPSLTHENEQHPVLCRFSDAGNDGAIDALGRPASEKR